MLNDAKSCTWYKWSMLWCLKLETCKATCTTAMQYMKHMANITQNSPRACQNDAKTYMEGSQNKLAWWAWSMKFARPKGRITLHLLRPSTRWLCQQKSELYYGKITPKKHTEMIARRLRHEGIHKGSCLRHKTPTLQSIERVTKVSVWQHYMNWNNISNDAKSWK